MSQLAEMLESEYLTIGDQLMRGYPGMLAQKNNYVVFEQLYGDAVNGHFEMTLNGGRVLRLSVQGTQLFEPKRR
jgi:hypothetical protein